MSRARRSLHAIWPASQSRPAIKHKIPIAIMKRIESGMRMGVARVAEVRVEVPMPGWFEVRGDLGRASPDLGGVDGA